MGGQLQSLARHNEPEQPRKMDQIQVLTQAISVLLQLIWASYMRCVVLCPWLNWNTSSQLPVGRERKFGK